MRLTKQLMGAAALLLVSATAAVAAGSPPSGTYSGDVHSTTASGKPNTFTVTATLDKGKLTDIKGQGGQGGGVIPYNKKLSTSTYCGAANSFDSSNMGAPTKITGEVNKQGRFAFTATTTKFHIVVTLKGHFTSATSARARFRYYQSHMPDKGHCDSGELRLTLKSS